MEKLPGTQESLAWQLFDVCGDWTSIASHASLPPALAAGLLPLRSSPCGAAWTLAPWLSFRSCCRAKVECLLSLVAFGEWMSTACCRKRSVEACEVWTLSPPCSSHVCACLPRWFLSWCALARWTDIANQVYAKCLSSCSKQGSVLRSSCRQDDSAGSLLLKAAMVLLSGGHWRRIACHSRW